MYLKIILSVLIGFSFYLNPMGRNLLYAPIPSVVPLTLCDKRYSIEMDRALINYRKIGNSAARADLIKVAEEYMILIKHQQDLDIAIRTIEKGKIFDLDAFHILRKPLESYIRCKNQTDKGLSDNSKYARSFEVNSKVPTVTRLGFPLFTDVGPCDRKYAIWMEKALDDLKSILKTDIIKIAEEYMVLIKQQQDVDVRIRELELRVFSLSTINILRRPIEEYVKCRDSLRTGTYSINFYR